MGQTKKTAKAEPRKGAVRKKQEAPQKRNPGAVGCKPQEQARVDVKPLRPSQCRSHLRRELASSFRGIVEGFVKQAESGGVQHLKLAAELLDSQPRRKRQKGSAQTLLAKLRRMGAEDGARGEDEDRVDEAWPE